MATETELDKPAAPSSNGKPDAAPLSILAKDDSLSGRLTMKSDGQILGRFDGEVDCEGELLIGTDAELSANIRTVRIVIAGLVRGNVYASGRLKITATGRLEGDAKVGALVVQEGGVHHGVIRVHPEGIPEEEEVVIVDEAPAPEPQAGALTNSVERVKKFWGEFF